MSSHEEKNVLASDCRYELGRKLIRSENKRGRVRSKDGKRSLLEILMKGGGNYMEVSDDIDDVYADTKSK